MVQSFLELEAQRYRNIVIKFMNGDIINIPVPEGERGLQIGSLRVEIAKRAKVFAPDIKLLDGDTFEPLTGYTAKDIIAPGTLLQAMIIRSEVHDFAYWQKVLEVHLKENDDESCSRAIEAMCSEAWLVAADEEQEHVDNEDIPEKILLKACLSGKTNIVRVLLDKAPADSLNVDHVDHEGNNALCLAAGNGFVEITKLLLDAELCPNTPNRFGNSAISCAAYRGHLEVCKILLENGARLENRGVWDATPLCLAVMYNHLELARYLIKKGANVNSKSSAGNSLIKLAIRRDFGEMAMLLRVNGAKFGNNRHLKKEFYHLTAMSHSFEKHPSHGSNSTERSTILESDQFTILESSSGRKHSPIQWRKSQVGMWGPEIIEDKNRDVDLGIWQASPDFDRRDVQFDSSSSDASCIVCTKFMHPGGEVRRRRSSKSSKTSSSTLSDRDNLKREKRRQAASTNETTWDYSFEVAQMKKTAHQIGDMINTTFQSYFN